MEGPSPGQYGLENTLVVTGAGAGSEVVLASGLVPGSSDVPSCPGLAIGIARQGFFHLERVVADVLGRAEFVLDVPPVALDHQVYFQAVDRSQCTVSDRIDYRFERHPLDDELRVHHLQMRGTHNSYHLEPAVPVHPSHRYSHVPLDVQLEEEGVRAFELDLHRHLTGWRVYHISVVDAQSTCRHLVDCLSVIGDWSAANPEHAPVIIWLEPKDDTGGLPILDLTPVDEIIFNTFPPERLLTPDDVQGSYGSLRERLEAEGWPTLGETRGRVFFSLLDTGPKARTYSRGYTSLAGRAMFVNCDQDQVTTPVAAVRKLAPGAAEEIAGALAAGFFVGGNICNADESDEQCEQDLADGLRNGLNALKDDYPAPVPGRDYWADLPGGRPLLCNPLSAPVECNPLSVEDL